MDHRTDMRVANVSVNWNDPELESLLRRSESWQLDNRGGYAAQEVRVFVGWSSATGTSAALVWEREQSAVLAANFPIGQGEQLRIERSMDGSLRTLYGVVIDGREGFREEDAKKGIRLYWLRVR